MNDKADTCLESVNRRYTCNKVDNIEKKFIDKVTLLILKVIASFVIGVIILVFGAFLNQFVKNNYSSIVGVFSQQSRR